MATSEGCQRYTRKRNISNAWINRCSDAELVIVLYFYSRGVAFAPLAGILSRRGFSRTRHAIASKLKAVTIINPRLRLTPRKWNLSEVDRWIDNLSLTHGEVSSLVQINNEGVEIIDVVGVSRPFISVYYSWRLNMIYQLQSVTVLLNKQSGMERFSTFREMHARDWCCDLVQAGESGTRLINQWNEVTHLQSLNQADLGLINQGRSLSAGSSLTSTSSASLRTRGMLPLI